MAVHPHVLVAEDEDLVAMAIADVLEAEGFRVTVTHNGLQALEAYIAEPSDILLTDMRMPVMGGEALIKIIRQQRDDLPIIVMTGFSEYIPENEPGRLVVLRKPFSLYALIHHIKASLLN